MRIQRAGDLRVKPSDLATDRLQRGHERQHDLPARRDLDLAGAALGRLAQPFEQLSGGLFVVVVAGFQERLKALLPQPVGVFRAWVTLQERQRDRAVEIVEQADRGRPEPLKLSTQLVAHRDPRGD
jgi:hypothetical protein